VILINIVFSTSWYIIFLNKTYRLHTQFKLALVSINFTLYKSKNKTVTILCQMNTKIK
jgi:hypothetical protein